MDALTRERHHHHHRESNKGIVIASDPNVSHLPPRMKIGVFNESIFDLYPAGFHPFCLYYYILITFRSITGCVRTYKRANSPELFFYRRYSIPAYIPGTIITVIGRPGGNRAPRFKLRKKNGNSKLFPLL